MRVSLRTPGTAGQGQQRSQALLDEPDAGPVAKVLLMERTVSQIRAISADPVRLDLVEALRDEQGPLTTRVLEKRVPAARGGIENHLQRLADGGWIESAGGSGRNTKWTVSASGVSWSDAESANPDVALAIDELYWVAAQRRINRMRHFDAERQTGNWNHDWVEAAIGVDYLVRLNATELAEFEEELVALVLRYRERTRGAEVDEQGRERVFVTCSAFPVRFGG